MTARQKPKPKRNSQESGEYEPNRANKMNLFPVLYDDYACDGDRHQHGKGSGDLQRNVEGEQWDRD